jgi:hypothetical protein
MITYRDRVTPVELGDRVQMRVVFRKHRGRVVYVPGVSRLNAAMEYNGLRWVGVRLEEGGFVSLVVDPDAGHLRNRVALLGRDTTGVAELPPDEDPHSQASAGRVPRALAWIAAALCCAAAARAEDRRPEPCRAERGATEGLPSEIRAKVGKTREMAPCALASLPDPVREALAAALGQPQPRMADPGQRWNSSDLGSGDLPRRQLVRAAHSESAWVIDYRQGGFAASYHVVVIAAGSEEARLLWRGRCGRGRSGKGRWQCAEAARRPVARPGAVSKRGLAARAEDPS